MSRAETEKGLRGVREEAVADLEALDRERHQLERLIEFIDEYTGGEAGQVRPAVKRTRRRAKASAYDVVRERPGVRTSMLAMVLDRPWEKVADELVDLERQGKVQREGRGWHLVRDG